MINAKHNFGVDQAVICSQIFHLPRCLYLAHAAGIDAVGMVSDRRRYSQQRYNAAREQLAIARAVIETAWDRLRKD